MAHPVPYFLEIPEIAPDKEGLSAGGHATKCVNCRRGFVDRFRIVGTGWETFPPDRTAASQAVLDGENLQLACLPGQAATHSDSLHRADGQQFESEVG